MNSNFSRLLSSLCADEAATRAEAAEQLALLGPDAQAAAVALVLACGDAADEVRQWGTVALEGMGPPEASDVGHLASFLEGRSPDVGYWAATLLGRLKDKAAPAVDALARAAGRSPHLQVRQRAAWALARIGPAAASTVATLQKAAGDSHHHFVQDTIG